MSSQTNDSKHTTTGRSTVNEPLAVTDGGQPLSFEPEDCGKKSAQHKFIDRYEYDFQPKFPQPSPARTNLHSDDVPERETKLTRFWKLQHGKGHTYEGWDTQRVRIEDRDDFRRASALLSQLEVTSFEAVRQRVMSECVNGFNRHYGGFDGACVGFALLYEHETIDKAKDSHLLEKAEEMIDADCEQLAEYEGTAERGVLTRTPRTITSGYLTRNELHHRSTSRRRSTILLARLPCRFFPLRLGF